MADAPESRLSRGGMILRCRVVLQAFELDIDVSFDSRVVPIFGPSGAGKTTLLDAIAGLRPVDEGEIEIGGRVLFSSSRGIDLAPRQRKIGYVPQETALFPHLSVRRNVLFGAGRGRGSSSPPLEQVASVLEIGPLLDRPVTSLSGGEAQRVALARAILSAPELLLLDEPLASLDVALKDRILPYLGRVRDEFSLPMIYVSHDPREVLALADWVVMLRRGRVVAQGVPGEVLRSISGVPEFADLELENVLTVELARSEPGRGRTVARLPSGQELSLPLVPAPPARRFRVGISGNDILVATEKPGALSATNVLAGTITSLERTATEVFLQVEAGALFSVRLTADAAERLALAPGKAVYLIIKAHSFKILY
jgi:molybdate transport system ATP-binding protein